MLENGANVNEATKEGRTALHICCSLGYLDSVQVILSHHQSNLNLLMEDIWGKTALDVRCCHIIYLKSR